MSIKREVEDGNGGGDGVAGGRGDYGSPTTATTSHRQNPKEHRNHQRYTEVFLSSRGDESCSESDSDREDLQSEGSTSSHTVDETNIHLISGQLGKFVNDMSPHGTHTEPIISQLRNRRSSSISTRPSAWENINDATGSISRGVGTGHQRNGSHSSAVIHFAPEIESTRPSLSIDVNPPSRGSLRNNSGRRPPRRGSSLNSTTTPNGQTVSGSSNQQAHHHSLHHHQQHQHHDNPSSFGPTLTFTDEPESLGSPFSPTNTMFPPSSSSQYPHRKQHHKRPTTPDYDSDGEYSENVSYAGTRPSSRRTSIQLHFQEPRSRRSSVTQKSHTHAHAPSPILGGPGASRWNGSQAGTPLTRQYSRNSNGLSRKGSINFVTPSLPSPGGFRNASGAGAVAGSSTGGGTGSARRTGSRSRRSSLFEDDRDDSRLTWQWDQHTRRATGESAKSRRYTISDRYPDDWRGRVRQEDEEYDEEDDEGSRSTSRTDGEDVGYPPSGRSAGKIYSTPVPGSSTFTVSRGGRGRSKSTSFSISTSVKKGPSNVRRNILISFLVILGLFLLGTVLVLSSIQRYLYIQDWAYLTELELGGYNEKTAGRIEEFQQEGSAPSDEDGADIGADWKVDSSGAIWGAQGKGTGSYWMRNDWDGRVRETDWDRLGNVTNLPGESVPRLIHQTWKSDVLPEKWRKVWKACREGMPDYEYMLWTDDTSRKFIAEKYPSFLATFDGYEYPIQRADAIRYFVLHYYGGVYMDLDIGCKRRLDPLLQGDWDVILPRTKPVGVSNDLMFSSKRSSFMEATIHGLIAFNHKYVTNYPTVMFSTGPMFLSVQYGLYTSAHPLTPGHPRADVRILPKSLYGKNAKAGEAPHSFFSHFYGSSWHADDAGFIVFLGTSGKIVFWIGLVVFIAGGLRFLCSNNRTARSGRRSLRKFVMASTGYRSYHMVSILPTSESHDGSRTASPSVSSVDTDESDGDDTSRIIEMVKAIPAMLLPQRQSKRGRAHNDRSNGMFFYVPNMAGESSSRHARSASTGSVPATTGGPRRFSSSGRTNTVNGVPYTTTSTSLQDSVVPEQTEDESERSPSPRLSVLKSLDWMSSPGGSPAPPPYNTLDSKQSDVK